MDDCSTRFTDGNDVSGACQRKTCNCKRKGDGKRRWFRHNRLQCTYKGTRNGTLTDTDGKYAISANTGDTLVFSYIGCITQEKTVKSAKLNVVLQESPEALKESMVTGYTVGESVEDVSSEEIRIMYVPVRQELPSEEYNEIVENGFMKVKDTPLSTFSIDVDAAAYGNMRRYLNKGQLPPADAVRTEELINYFPMIMRNRRETLL